MLTINDEATIEDIDEAIGHVREMLRVDKYGNRMDWRKKELLEMSIDDLLDARLVLQQK